MNGAKLIPDPSISRLARVLFWARLLIVPTGLAFALVRGWAAGWQ